MENLVTDIKKCFDKVPEFDKLNSKQILWNSTGKGLRQHAPSHENDIKRILDYINVLVSEGKIQPSSDTQRDWRDVHSRDKLPSGIYTGQGT